MLEASKTVGSGRLYHGPVRAKTGKGVIWVGGRHFRDAWLLAAHSPRRRRAAGQPLDRRDSHARGQLERNPAFDRDAGADREDPAGEVGPLGDPGGRRAIHLSVAADDPRVVVRVVTSRSFR